MATRTALATKGFLRVAGIKTRFSTPFVRGVTVTLGVVSNFVLALLLTRERA